MLAGHFGQRGSGIIASLGGGSTLCAERVPLGPVPDVAGTVNMNRVGAILCGEEPGAAPARVLFVQGANPAATAPDQRTMLRGLAREDVFTVVHEQVMTDTARFADVVLPATTHFEADDVADSYGSVRRAAGPGRDRPRRREPHERRGGRRAGRAARAWTARSSIPTRPGCWPACSTEGAVDGVEVLRQPGEHGAVRRHLPVLPRPAGPGSHVPDGELPLPRYRPLDSPLPARP